MGNTSIEISNFLLEQARYVRGAAEFADFETYKNTSEKDRKSLDELVISHYNGVMKVIEKMKSYGENHWWILDTSESALPSDLQKKIRSYYQVFDCGIDTLLVPQARLLNDLNDIFQHTTGSIITSWMLIIPVFFEKYKAELYVILKSDYDLQKYLKGINSE